jgi:hypothetical protein
MNTTTPRATGKRRVPATMVVTPPTGRYLMVKQLKYPQIPGPRTTRQAQGGHSTSTGPQTRRLATADQLRLLKVGQGLLLASGVPPVMLRLRRVGS